MSVNHYRVRCNTENINVNYWGKIPPTTCPNNNTHSINTDSIVILQMIKDSNVNIINEHPPENAEYTQGRFRCNGLECDIPVDSYTIKDFGWVYPICASEINFETEIEHIGDYLDLYVIPSIKLGNTSLSIEMNDNIIPLTDDCFALTNVGMQLFIMDNTYTFFLGGIISKNSETKSITITNACDRAYNKNSFITYMTPVGVITQNITPLDNLITVSSEVMVMKQGQFLTVTDGTTMDNLGEIFEVNQSDLSVLIQSPPTVNYNSGSLLFPSVHVIKNYKINTSSRHQIGGNTIGGSYINSFYIIRLVYRNMLGTVKKFNWYVEYKY